MQDALHPLCDLVPARAVEVEPQRPLLALTGVALRCGRGPARVARLAEGMVAQFAGRDCARGRDGRAAQVVGEQPAERAAVAQGHGLAAGLVVLPRTNQR